jgi:serine/threonine protein kinase
VDLADRDSVLRARCGTDEALRAEVDALLGALDVPDDSFLDPAGIPSLDAAAVDGPWKPGTALGSFLVLRAIGSGGMGVVYAAQQHSPRRTVAIKVLRRGYRHPEILKRFEREADLLGQLQHPGIAQVFSFHVGDKDSPAHLVMEFVSGPPITEYCRAHALTIPERVALTTTLCDAVQHAHDRGIIHRDLKPANVLISDNGQPKILDFGIARAIDRDAHSVHTAPGQVIGTLAYMSPEQLSGATVDIDARSDVYAIGVLFYRLIAGHLPFDLTGLPWVEAAQRLLQIDPPRLAVIDPSLDGPLDQITARAMSRDRTERYQTAAELADDLRACLDGRAPAPRQSADVPRTPQTSQPMLATSFDHRLVAVALVSGRIAVLDADSGRQIALLEERVAPVSKLAFCVDGRLSVSRMDGRVDLLDVPAAS